MEDEIRLQNSAKQRWQQPVEVLKIMLEKLKIIMMELKYQIDVD